MVLLIVVNCHPTGKSNVTVPSCVVVEKLDTPATVSVKLDTGCHAVPFQNAHVTPLARLPNVPVRTTTRLNGSVYPTYKYASHCAFGVRVIVGVSVGVRDSVRVSVTVGELVGVIDSVRVSVGVTVNERVGVTVGVSDRVGVRVFVSDGVSVTDNVFETV